MDKNLRINLQKEAKCLYSEIYKMLIKETEEDKNKEKDISCSWWEELILPNYLYYLKQTIDLM